MRSFYTVPNMWMNDDQAVVVLNHAFLRTVSYWDNDMFNVELFTLRRCTLLERFFSVTTRLLWDAQQIAVANYWLFVTIFYFDVQIHSRQNIFALTTTNQSTAPLPLQAADRAPYGSNPGIKVLRDYFNSLGGRYTTASSFAFARQHAAGAGERERPLRVVQTETLAAILRQRCGCQFSDCHHCHMQRQRL